jgi:hypothetical protein
MLYTRGQMGSRFIFFRYKLQLLSWDDHIQSNVLKKSSLG